MLRPGTALILGIATRPGAAEPDTDLAAMDTTEDVLVHGTIGDGAGGDRVLRDLIRRSSTRLLLAYNADSVREWLLVQAGRRDIDPAHLEDPDRWGCIMRARSAALGTPDHLYPLGVAHDAIAAAWAALDLIGEIAEQRCPAAPGFHGKSWTAP